MEIIVDAVKNDSKQGLAEDIFDLDFTNFNFADDSKILEDIEISPTVFEEPQINLNFVEVPQTDPEPVVEVIEEPAPVSETVEEEREEIKEEPVEDIKENSVEEVKEEPIPEPVVEKKEPPKKRGRKAKEKEPEVAQAKETEPVEVSEIVSDIVEEFIDNGEIEVPETKEKVKFDHVKADYSKLNLNEFVNKFYPAIEDEKWDAFREDIDARLEKTLFDEEINDGSIRIILASLANIYAEVRPTQAYYDSLYNTFTNKVTGLIPRQIALNSNAGNSVAEKKVNAQKACEAAKIDGMKGTYNLPNYVLIIDERRNYLKNVIDRLSFVNNCIVGIQSVRKRESEGV
jgi:hypothetical protein